VTPDDLLDDHNADLSPTGRRSDVYSTPASDILQRGQAFFDAIYGKLTKRVMGQMDRSGTEDLGLVARLVYGYVLSNTSILSAAETSFVMIAGLIPQDVSRPKLPRRRRADEHLGEPPTKGASERCAQRRSHCRRGESCEERRHRTMSRLWNGSTGLPNARRLGLESRTCRSLRPSATIDLIRGPGRADAWGA